MPMVVDTALDVVPAERGFLVLTDRATGEACPQVARLRAGTRGEADLPISRPVLADCMERRVSILCPDLMAEERYHEGDLLALDHIRSVLCVPVPAGDQVVGAIYLDAASEHSPFGEHDLDLVTAIAAQAGVALHRAQLIDELERLFLGAIETLVATVEAKDIYTYGHSARVSKLGHVTAAALGRPEDELEEVKIAGLLHDIGKIGIPETILSKAGPLTDEEWAYVRSHPQIGESIIRQMGSERLAGVERIVRHHHERLDGTGYPDGLPGAAIPLGARILGVADAYDAMTSNRPYRKAFSPEAAIKEVRRCAGQQFDPEVVDAFIAARADRPEMPTGDAVTQPQVQ
jgi:HD-GYP domain-containing protein (c-di-GMP phosphodiesterase class II)